LSLSTVNYFI